MSLHWLLEDEKPRASVYYLPLAAFLRPWVSVFVINYSCKILGRVFKDLEVQNKSCLVINLFILKNLDALNDSAAIIF